MKALLFFCLIGLAIYAGLVYTHDSLSEGTPPTVAAATPDHPAPGRLSSWASDLNSIRQRPETRVAAPSPEPRETDVPAVIPASTDATLTTASITPEPVAAEVEPAVSAPLSKPRHAAPVPVQATDEFITRTEVKRARWSRRAERRRGFGLFRRGRD